jgi:integrase/recombinase XerD
LLQARAGGPGCSLDGAMAASAPTIRPPAAALIERYLDAMWMERVSATTRWPPTDATFPPGSAGWNAALLAPEQARREDLQAYLGHALHTRAIAALRGPLPVLPAGLLPLPAASRAGPSVDPTLDLDSPRLGRPLPKSLSERRRGRLLRRRTLDDLLGFRDRCMLELLYACGLRVSSSRPCNWPRSAWQPGRGARGSGKGGKERLVPMGEEALHWLQRYLAGPRANSCWPGAPAMCCFPVAAAGR